MEKGHAIENTTQGISSLPPYLNLFDPFAVLVPEKIAGNSNDNQQTDSLPDFLGSLLNAKKDPNVVDVFDNLFVTPEQVSGDKSTTFYDVEFSKFLDKYDDQKVEKLIDITGTSDSDFEIRPEVKINVLEPKLNLREDLIKKIFLEEGIENMRLREISNDNSMINKVPLIVHSPSNIECDNNTQDLIRHVTETNINNFIRFDKGISQTKNITNSSTTLQYNKEAQITQILTNYHALIAVLTPENSNNFFIEFVTKDPKLFRKQRIVKPESEILNYTKGVSFLEKSIRLPKIMNRLANRNKYVLNGKYKKETENIHLKEAKDISIVYKTPSNPAPSKAESGRSFMSMIGHNNNMNNNNVSCMTDTNSNMEHDIKLMNYLKSTPNDFIDLRLNKDHKESEVSQIFIKHDTNKVTPTPVNSNKFKIFIETVAKDPKVFKKQRIIKPEREILKYTKGASLHEKSIVLPQIMERLLKTKMANNTKKNLSKKLILDTGTSAFNVLEKQYTDQRETRRKKMEEYINHQQISCLNVNLASSPNGHTSTCKNNNKSNSNIKTSDIAASNINKSNIEEVSNGTDIQRQILLSMISNIRNNRASTSKENERNEGESSKNKESSLEVLMEDCNRQRLIEFERRRLFEKFVLGKI